MSYVIAARGGTPEFKGWFCEGQWAEYGPPYDTGRVDYAPPFNSHADGAFGQGYLNLHFPLVPNLDGTYGHHWMQEALRGIKNQNDILFTNWVPLRAYVDSIYLEVSRFDKMLVDVTVTPVAYRMAYDFIHNRIGDPAEITEFSTQVTTALSDNTIPLAEAANGSTKLAYFMLRLNGMESEGSKPPCTFGHNLVVRNAQGKPTKGLDSYFGVVLLGLKFGGIGTNIANVWKSDIAVHFSAKLLAFEGSTQIG